MNNLAIIRIEKGKGSPSGLIAHIDRTASEEVALKDYPHVNKSKIKDNIEFTDNYGKSGQSCIDEIMKIGYKSKRKIREDTVRYANGILTASPDIMNKIQDQGMLEQWTKTNVNWLKNKYGKDNFVRISLHLDESTPHIQFVFVPLTADGRLSAKEVIGDKNDLSQLQTDYAAAMAKFGIERGEFKSKAEHHHYKEFHDLINKTKLNLEEIGKPNLLNYNSVHEKTKIIIAKEAKQFFENEQKLEKKINKLRSDLRNEKKTNKETMNRSEIISQIKEKVHCVDFFKHLSNLGILEFEKTEGKNYIFRKTNQTTGSLVVRLKQNKWTDFDGGRQSDVFDACKFFLGKDFNESLKYLSDFSGQIIEPIPMFDSETNKTIEVEVKNEINIPTNEALLQYASERGISRQILNYSEVKELHYNIESYDNGSIKSNNYFGLSIKNESNGYSIRNKLIKRNIGNQGISDFFSSLNEKYYISEGMFDYLSLLELKLLGNHIILNSTSNVSKLKNLNLSKAKLYLALNYDDAGKTAAAEITKLFPNAINLTDYFHEKYLKKLEKWDYNEVLEILRKHQKEKKALDIERQEVKQIKR